MAWKPIANTVPQYHVSGAPASGYVLKPYAAGTSTAINFATGSGGGTQVGSIALNSEGYPEVSNNIVIPHLEQDYKLALYPSQAAADSDTGAVWSIDNLSLEAAGTNLSNVTGTNTITATASPTIASYTVGDRFWLVPENTNTGAVTLNIDSVGAGAVQLNGSALAGAELQEDVPVQLQVTAVTPVFEIVSNGNAVPAIGAQDVKDKNSESLLPQVGEMFFAFGTTHAKAVMMYGETLGDTGSGGDLADPKYEALFEYLWDNVADSEAAVSSGRGASASADWTAGKTITVPDMRGRVVLGKDNMGGSSANVVTDSEADTVADLGGAEDHTMTTGELVQHNHSMTHTHGAGSYAVPEAASPTGGTDEYAGTGSPQAANQAVTGTSGASSASNTGNQGSSNAFSVMNPYMTVNVFIRY